MSLPSDLGYIYWRLCMAVEKETMIGLIRKFIGLFEDCRNLSGYQLKRDKHTLMCMDHQPFSGYQLRWDEHGYMSVDHQLFDSWQFGYIEIANGKKEYGGLNSLSLLGAGTITKGMGPLPVLFLIWLQARLEENALQFADPDANEIDLGVDENSFLFANLEPTEDIRALALHFQLIQPDLMEHEVFKDSPSLLV
jgi:hypothetical protein